MRLKKLMASLLSLSFVTALLPGATLAVNAAVLPDDTYIFYEDFENVTEPTGFESPEGSLTVLKSSYQTEIVGDNGETNTYMQYERTTTDRASNVWYQKNLKSKVSQINKNGGLYEVGLRLKYNQMNQYGTLFALRFAVYGYENAFQIEKRAPNNSEALAISGIPNISKNGVMADTWMDITVQFSMDPVKRVQGKTTVVYIDADGEEVTQTGEYVVTGTDIWWSGNVNNMDIIASTAYGDPTSTTPWGIDDIYFKKLPARDVTFYNGDSLVDTKKPTIHGELAEVPALEDVLPTWEEPGKDFTGWYEDEDCTIEFENAGITQPKTVYAGWVPRYYVKFNECGGTDVEDDSTIDGTVALPAITRENHRFDGWFTHETERGEEYIFTGENITQNTQVWAGWTEGERVNLNANGGQAYVGGVPVDVTYEVDTIISLPTPTRLGYTFKGWFTDEELTEAVVYGETPVIPDMTVYAAWEIDWVVTLELNGGTVPDTADYVYDDEEGNKVIYVSKDVGTTPLPTLTKLGFSFEVWCTDETLKNVFDGTVNDDITIYAKYNNVLFYEDFDDETNDTLDWLQTLTLTDYNKYKDEYGVVEDTLYSEEGNKSFRFATKGNSLIIPISNGGPGIYEFSMKIRQAGPPSEYVIPGNLGSFRKGDTVVAGGGVNGNSPSFGTNNHPTGNLLTTASYNWIYITYRYDTVSGLGTQIIKYNTGVGYTTSEKFNIKHSQSSHVDSIIVFGFSGKQGTNFYLDEISVKMIEAPTAQFEIEGAPVVDGVATNAALTPEIKINFSELMDAETLNSSTILVKDSEGTELLPADYLISTEVVNEKTVATVNIIKNLEKSSLYTVTVTTGAGTGDFYVAEDIAYTFKTIPEDFELIVTKIENTTDGTNYTDVTSLVGLRNLRIGIDVRNFSGGNGTDGNGRKVFVGAAVVNKTTGRQHAYTFGEATIQEGETQAVISNGRLSGWAATHGALTADDELHIFVWDGRNTRSSLTEVYKFPN